MKVARIEWAEYSPRIPAAASHFLTMRAISLALRKRRSPPLDVAPWHQKLCGEDVDQVDRRDGR
jgi:hypothetical protein